MAKLSQVKIEPVAMDELNLFWTNNINDNGSEISTLDHHSQKLECFWCVGSNVIVDFGHNQSSRAKKKQQGQRIEILAWQHLLWIQRQSTRSCQTRSNDIEEVDCRSRDLSLLQIPNGEELFQVLTGPPPQSRSSRYLRLPLSDGTFKVEYSFMGGCR